MSDRTVYDSTAPKPPTDLRSRPPSKGRPYARAYRDGVARTLKELRRGYSHAEIDGWYHTLLLDWVEDSGPTDPAPPISDLPESQRR